MPAEHDAPVNMVNHQSFTRSRSGTTAAPLTESELASDIANLLFISEARGIKYKIVCGTSQRLALVRA
jgi:hypothetical protein